MQHKAKKALGQNFLKSEPALNMMCEAGAVTTRDIVLEIGPGKGALTAKLLERAGKVIAVEKDYELIPILEERFKDEISKGRLILAREDILEFNPTEYNLKEGKYKVIANIPYNITGAIIKKFLAETLQPSAMVLLVQKEVATRIVASDKKESILSLSVKAYGKPSYMMKVHKRFFTPSPKVDSAIVAIQNISKDNFKNKDDEDRFFEIVRAGFAHKRKFLKSNLGSVSRLHDHLDEAFAKHHIDPKSRAEDIGIDTWLELARYIL
jgi:16S rRNA (adenine1518-N6/adenine1519-N6)-dimethyltransferase